MLIVALLGHATTQEWDDVAHGASVYGALAGRGDHVVSPAPRVLVTERRLSFDFAFLPIAKIHVAVKRTGRD